MAIRKSVGKLATAFFACLLAGTAAASPGGLEIAIEATPRIEPILPAQPGNHKPAAVAAGPSAVLVAQAGSLRLDLQLDTLSLSDILYKSDKSGDIFRIQPDDRRLLATWKQGGSITGFNVPVERPTTVALNIAVRNMLPTPAVISNARLEVEHSRVDRQPLLQLFYAGWGDNGLGTRFLMRNLGWGNPIEGSYQYGFVDPAAPQDTKVASTVIVRQSFPSNPGASWYLDIRSGLARLGVDVKQFERWADVQCTAGIVPGIQCKGAGDQACLGDLQRNGLLGSLGAAASMKDGLLQTDIIGMAIYKWRDTDGTIKSATGSFRKTLALGRRQIECSRLHPSVAPPPPPPPPPPERSPESPIPVDLVMDGVGYGIDLPVERTLAPGASTRIRLLIRSDKSSANRLRFVLKANGSDVESNVIDLLAFVARR